MQQQVTEQTPLRASLTPYIDDLWGCRSVLQTKVVGTCEAVMVIKTWVILAKSEYILSTQAADEGQTISLERVRGLQTQASMARRQHILVLCVAALLLAAGHSAADADAAAAVAAAAATPTVPQTSDKVALTEADSVRVSEQSSREKVGVPLQSPCEARQM